MPRIWLLGLFRLGCTCAAAAAAPTGGKTPAQPRILVVGAGAAGLGAATAIFERGLRADVVVLEASNRTGGRVHAAQFGVAANVTIELGANWIQGVGSSSHVNPALNWSQALGLRTVRVPGSDQSLYGYGHVYDSAGKRAPAERLARRVADAEGAYDCIGPLSLNVTRDISVREALRICGWTPQDSVDYALDSQLTQSDFAISPAETSLLREIPDYDYTLYGPDDLLVVEQRPRGFARVLDYAAAAVLPSVVYNAAVAQLQYSEDGVRAILNDGRAFEADYAVVALPLGVLQHGLRHGLRHRQDKRSEGSEPLPLFSPPLPAEQHAAILNNTMANFTKFFMQFATAFWEEGGASETAGASMRGEAAPVPVQWLMGSDEEGGLTEWHNLNHPDVLPGSRTLLAIATGDAASRYELMSDDALTAIAMARLRTSWPAAPEPVAFNVTRHATDPLMYGAYSANALYFDGFDAQQAPLQPQRGPARVFFAGEHVCKNLQGYVQGGWESGRRAVTKWLEPILSDGVLREASICDVQVGV
jgi:polyamine oxidase